MAHLQDIIQLTTPERNTQRKVLIYFVPGNPGLVEYYRRFLETIYRRLTCALEGEHIYIYGASHDGFEFHEETKHLHNQQNHAPPYSLSEEIAGVISKVSRQAHRIAELHPDCKVDAILVGHSVGSYMLLEAIEWHQKQPSEQQTYRIVGGICLFPTIVDMFRSDKGRVFRWILPMPGLGWALTGIIRVLQWFAPAVLRRVAKRHTPGPEGWEVTEALAKSAYGIRQVLYLARNELDEIRHDKWHPANLWGVLDHEEGGGGDDPTTTTTTTTTTTADTRHVNGFLQPSPRTRLLFLWGHKDYWVHDNTRDQVIAKRHTRGTHETRYWPWMEIAENKDIPHTFSLNPEHSDHVANKAVEWIVWLVKDERQ